MPQGSPRVQALANELASLRGKLDDVEQQIAFSQTVFKIGTGDVFSAVFTHHWCEKNELPAAAALAASKAVAFYAESRSLRISPIAPDPIVARDAHVSVIGFGSYERRPVRLCLIWEFTLSICRAARFQAQSGAAGGYPIGLKRFFVGECCYT
jgi:hypothetical protein